MTLNTTLHGLRAAATFAACLAAAPGVMAQAMPANDAPPDCGPPWQQHDDRHDGPGAPDTPPFLRGLDLTEAQQDRVFAILHELAPKRRAFEKAERRADDALRALAHAPQLDGAQAAAAAKGLGQAIADQELLRLQTRAQLKALLTAEQRARLDRPRNDDRKGARK